MKIELNSRDLEVKDVETREGIKEVVQIKPSVAFDEDFISEMKSMGVRKFVPREEETTE